MTEPPNASRIFEQAIAEHLTVIQAMSSQQRVLEQIAAEMVLSVRMGGKILWCGNGGSAADAQDRDHLALRDVEVDSLEDAAPAVGELEPADLDLVLRRIHLPIIPETGAPNPALQ